ncbi:MAG: hypothetical protein NC225_02550 [Clostridium sp.]|nr:hypothetical protein [Clostridium sp.]MCM1398343.1 hypothetical protein [Clostridium sp.]MCM1458992.1 hypothetical protein [Bacteroides sp.]
MNNENDIIQNLRDAGCDDGTITAFMTDFREERITDGLKLLAVHRRALLDDLHKDQKQIDCLDYLVYNIEKNEKVNV